jgi:hypothetical protein
MVELPVVLDTLIVSGLFRAYDLLAMQDLHNYRSKYVFTTHVYTFSWWFVRVDWVLAREMLK